MRRFASPLADKIWDAMNRLGSGPDKEVRLTGLHEDAGLTSDAFERGLNWLIYFGHIEKFAQHGATYIRQVKK